MKKLVKIIGALFCALVMFGCSDLAELNSDSGNENLGTLYFDSKSRFVDVSGISNANVKVYGYGMNTISKNGVLITGGKGSLSVENIPVGKNRVIEISGYKASGVPVKILYAVTDITPGANSIGTIKDGSDSAKGKAYLALLNAGVDISSVSLGGFDGVSSAYLFDADGFASAYKKNHSASAANYVQKTGTVKFTNIKSASGYSLWVDDPLSKKLSIDSDSTTSSSLSGVAPGTWKVYVSDGSATKVAGNVTVPSDGSVDFDALIGNALAGKTIVFVKCAANTNLYAWTETTEKELCGAWSGTTLTTTATSEYMNDPSGWYMIDVSEKYGSSTEKIKIILIPQGGSQTGNLESKIAGTFWYDYTSDTFYDSDPTTAPALDSDATLKEIKVNDTSVGLVTEYEVPAKTEKVTVTAVANSAAATVSVSPSGETSLVEGEPKSFTITVTAEDGTVKTYSLSVSRKTENPNDVTLSSINVNGSSIGALSGTSFKKSLSSSNDSCSVTVIAVANSTSATVTISPESATIADGNSKEFTITVKNGSASATYKLTVDYTKVEGSEYYWTNKNGAVGINKTISSFSDWSEDMKIVQGAANDDPRAFRGYHEKATDFYALYAAYDDTNLYLMVEMPSIDGRDITSKDWQYALDENLGMGVAINTGKRTPGDGELDTGITPWNSAGKFYSITEGVDTILMFHPAEYGTPGFFITKPDGKFSYDKEYCLTFVAQGVKTSKQIGLLSKTLYGRSNNGNLTKEEYLAKTDYVDMLADPQKTDVSGYMYQITISLKGLGINKNYLESNGISVMTFSTFGTSMMDALPWCSNLIDVASDAYSFDDSTSAEKEDVDIYDVPLARIGHM